MASKKYSLNRTDYKKIASNALIFSAPALIIFFLQLSQGVNFKMASSVALLAFYGVLADAIKKYTAGK